MGLRHLKIKLSDIIKIINGQKIVDIKKIGLIIDWKDYEIEIKTCTEEKSA